MFLSLLTWITGKEVKRQIQNKGDEFLWKKNMKIGGEKIRNANGQRGEMSGSEKQKRTRTQATTILVSTYDISYEMCNWDVSRCRRAKQRQINVQKRVLHLQSFFWLIRTIVFFCRSRCRQRLTFCLFE